MHERPIRPLARPLTLALALAAALAACDTVDENANPRCSWQRGVIETSAPHRQYVIDSIRFAGTPAEAMDTAVDLDCAEPVRRDNVLGQALAGAYNALDTDLDALVADMVEDGRIVHLLDVQAADLTQASGVGVQIFVGDDTDDDPSDNFSGMERFTVRPDTETAPMAGRIDDGQLAAHFGRVPLQIALPGVDERYVLDLQATGIEATIVRDDFIEARVGGALHQDDVESELMPIIYAVIADVIESECPADAPCPTDSRGASLVSVFDTDDDGRVSYDEYRQSPLVEALLAPDLDMFDETGAFAPGRDGVKDSLSLGVTITAVPADF